MKLKYLLLFCCLWFCGYSSFAYESIFYKIAVKPVHDVPRLFIARGQRIHVLFHSYDKNTASDDVEIFLKSPLIVTDHKAARSCAITDTQDWLRGQVYLNSDERYLLAGGRKGSSHYVTSYDTRTCQKIRQLEISAESWRIDGGHGCFIEKGSAGHTVSCTAVKDFYLSGLVDERTDSNIFYRVIFEPLKELPKLFVANGKCMSIFFLQL